jgi:hypothetical protein
MDKEKLNWRSFADGRTISEKWNAATPTYYVLDPKGVIRYKWVGSPGAKAIDTALERLIQDAERNGKKVPKGCCHPGLFPEGPSPNQPMKLSGPASQLFETQRHCGRPGNLSWSFDSALQS